MKNSTKEMTSDEIKARLARIRKLLRSMEPVKGECRTVEECCDCNHLFGRRFIPYGLGRGLTVDPCYCQITGHRPSRTITTREP
jgi:hypothetical protein